MFGVELWHRTGVILMDISAIVKRAEIYIERNEAERVRLSLDANEFEAICKAAAIKPSVVLDPLNTHVRIKIDGQYIVGAEVFRVGISVNANNSTLNIMCRGFLDMLKDRYVTKTYSSVDAADIARDLITETQNSTNGSLGITFGNNFIVGKNRDREYIRQNVKEGIINLSKLIDGRFDFKFDYEAKFFVYSKLGSDRTGFILGYPGNIQNLNYENDASQLANSIIALGSGLGDEVLTGVANDNTSQLNYTRREKITTFNSVLEQQTIDDHAQSVLDEKKLSIRQIGIETNSNFFDLTKFSVGDTITINIDDYNLVDIKQKPFRIEAMSIRLSGDGPATVKLTLDDYTL